MSYAPTSPDPVFDILPFLLLENAVKYAPANSQVDITIDEYPHSIDVKIESMGPLVGQEELAKLNTKGFRAAEAKKTGERVAALGFTLRILSRIFMMPG